MVITAEQYRAGANPPAKGVCRRPGLCSYDPDHVHILHFGQWVILEDGDWIIPETFDSTGHCFYPCKPDVFAATYEPIEDLDGIQSSVVRADG